MAEKEVVIRATLDTGDSVSKIEKLKRSLSDAGGNTELEARFKSLNQAVDKTNMSTRQMTMAIKQYQAIAIEAGQTSPIGIEALKRAGQLKDKLMDTQSQIKLMAADGKVLNASMALSSTVLNSYTAFVGVAQLAGGKQKELLQTMAKMQIIMQTLSAVENTVNQLRKGGAVYTYALVAANKLLAFATGGATAAMNAFRVALISTGIGALIVGIGMLIANFDKLVGWVKKLTGAYNEQAEAAIKAGEASVNAARMAREEADKEYERRLKIMKAQGKETYEYEKNYTEAKIALMRKEIEAFILKTRIEAQTGELEVEQIRERTKQIRDMLNEYRDLQANLTVLTIEHNKKKAESHKDVAKSIDLERQSIEKLTAIRLNAGQIEEEQMRLRAGYINEEATEYEIRAELAMRAIDRFKTYTNEAQITRDVLRSTSLDIIGNMGDVFSALADLQAQGSERQKKLALMAIVANQAQAIANAVLAASKAARDIVYDPTGVARIAVYASTFLSISASIISAIAQAKRLLGQGGTESVGSVRTGGGGGVGTQPQEQQETVQYYGTQQGQGLAKVVLVESDVTKAQSNANYIKKISAL